MSACPHVRSNLALSDNNPGLSDNKAGLLFINVPFLYWEKYKQLTTNNLRDN